MYFSTFLFTSSLLSSKFFHSTLFSNTLIVLLSINVRRTIFTPTKKQVKHFENINIHLTKYTCPIIIFYRTIVSVLCPDECYSEKVLSVLSSNKFGLNLKKKIWNGESTLTIRHIPDCSFVSFKTASRCQHYISARTRVLCLTAAGQVSLATGSPRSSPHR
jgi:hypothetical protein